ncbi:Diaminopimelate epimerase [Desulfovibrio sp. X2]|uniref:diaminopimelate epimerase n=1 Tax=Desulfovibrio sp. X2 TaxID=941449 RepID=UPI000358B9E0|nr:diaminopimelate epimerase [Desulfovibrio sp. X2]EPR44655.1 Diaminopimelate epimerase [Desulfovibrio sp. X2]
MNFTSSATIPFFKMQGTGNDFVVIDNRTLKYPRERMADFARAACHRAFGVGADGIFFLDLPNGRSDVDVVWDFYNADGSRAEMCGNGSRCAARLAHLLGMAPAHLRLGTDAGVVDAEVFEAEHEARVRLTAPLGQELNISLELEGGEKLTAHFVNTGVPHTVIFVDDVKSVDVARLGRAVRFHTRFAPAGTNVNFAQVTGKGSALLRTYERGVEGETLACGTGACATTVLAHALGLTGPEVAVTTSGGQELTITYADGAVFLRGKAEISFAGELDPVSIGLS